MLFSTAVQVSLQAVSLTRVAPRSRDVSCYLHLLLHNLFHGNHLQVKKPVHHLSVVSLGWTLSGERLYCFMVLMNRLDDSGLSPL